MTKSHFGSVSNKQFESYLYPFRTVLRFNVRFDVVTLHKSRVTTSNRTLNLKTVLNGYR